MNKIGTKILNSVELCYIGRMAEAKANLEVYLNNPVGVGEHSDITGEVKKLLLNIAESRDVLNTIGEIKKKWRLKNTQLRIMLGDNILKIWNVKLWNKATQLIF